MALIAAARDKNIDGVVTLDAAGSPGADLSSGSSSACSTAFSCSPAERQARIDLQKKIHAAVVSGPAGRACPMRCASRPTRRGSRAC